MNGNQRGFSLIELMVAVVIVGLLMAIAAPNYRTWIQNQQTRVAAESILNGLQVARTEAVKNNGKARFVMCALPDSSWEVLAVPAATASAGLGCGAAGAAGVVLVQKRSGQEGSRLATVAIVPAGEFAVTFNSFGRVVAGDAVAAPMTTISVSNPAGDRALNITMGVGGNIRMCDPSPQLAASDPRHC